MNSDPKNLKAIYDEMYGMKPRRVAEVGVNDPHLCSLLSFINEGIPTLLVEPLPYCCQNLRDAFVGKPVEVIEGVIGDKEGSVLLYDRGAGSWIEDVPKGGAPDEHPNGCNTKREEFNHSYVRTVRSYRWQMVDPSDIDVLCVDTEGAEWFVVREMISRPALVRCEMHFPPTGWMNPHNAAIRQKMEEMGYTVIGEDVSDVLWARTTK
jgi:hypothetical protein